MLKAEPGLSGKDAIEALSAAERQAVYDKVSAELPAWFGPDSSPETVLLENHLSVIQDRHIVTFQTTAYRSYSARGLAVISADPGSKRPRALGLALVRELTDETATPEIQEAYATGYAQGRTDAAQRMPPDDRPR